MIKIYHNPRCKHSRSGLKYLKSKGLEFETIDYLKTGLSENELKDILSKMNKNPDEMIRKQEEVYKKEVKGKDFDDDKLIKIISKNLKLLHRPIVETDDKAVFSRGCAFAAGRLYHQF